MIIQNLDNYSINKEAEEPLYKQLELILRELIEIGFYKVGSLLPTEQVLINKFDISRDTVRKAFSMLEQEGVIESKQGRGSIVKKLKLTKISTSLDKWYSFTKEMEEQNIKTVLIWFLFEVETINGELKALFKSPTKDTIVKWTKVVGREDAEVAFISYFNPNLHLNKDSDFLQYSFTQLYEHLKNKHNIHVKSAKNTISTERPTKEIMRLLNIKNKHIPILVRKLFVYDKDDMLIEYCTAYYRGDRFSITNESIINN